jgi:DNA-binding transcriptional MerR regulator
VIYVEQYTIKQASELLLISKDTLRYYDKLKLICPKRCENRYRYYTKQDILDLQYIEVLKYANFTLAEIQQFFKFKRRHDMDIDGFGITRLFEDKKQEFQQKIKTYQMLITLIDKTLHLKKQISALDNTAEINELVSSMFEKLRSHKYEK